jgi:hypothetical protein
MTLVFLSIRMDMRAPAVSGLKRAGCNRALGPLQP